MLLEIEDQVLRLELQNFPNLLADLNSLLFVSGALDPDFDQILLLADGEHKTNDIILELFGNTGEDKPFPFQVVHVRFFLLLDLKNPAATVGPVFPTRLLSFSEKNDLVIDGDLTWLFDVAIVAEELLESGDVAKLGEVDFIILLGVRLGVLSSRRVPVGPFAFKFVHHFDLLTEFL